MSSVSVGSHPGLQARAGAPTAVRARGWRVGPRSRTARLSCPPWREFPWLDSRGSGPRFAEACWAESPCRASLRGLPLSGACSRGVVNATVNAATPFTPGQPCASSGAHVRAWRCCSAPSCARNGRIPAALSNANVMWRGRLIGHHFVRSCTESIRTVSERHMVGRRPIAVVTSPGTARDPALVRLSACAAALGAVQSMRRALLLLRGQVPAPGLEAP